jgi:hypothetical protein
MMNEAVGTSEASVYFNETTPRNIPEGCHHHTRRPENLECQKKECYEGEHVYYTQPQTANEQSKMKPKRVVITGRKQTTLHTQRMCIVSAVALSDPVIINTICVIFSGLLFKPRRLKKKCIAIRLNVSCRDARSPQGAAQFKKAHCSNPQYRIALLNFLLQAGGRENIAGKN